jgi:DNA-binding LacI/PurR family transcriptional regulator
MPLRAIARASGVTTATVHRFLGGKPIVSTKLDQLVAWIELRERTPKGGLTKI